MIGSSSDRTISSFTLTGDNGGDGYTFFFGVIGETSDNTTIILSDVEDTWVYGADATHANANFGDSGSMLSYPTSNCNNANAIMYLGFDLTSAPETVDQVNLVVKHVPHTSHCYSNCNADFYFYPVSEDWDEMTITYNTRPQIENNPLYGPINITFPNNLGQRKYDITNTYRQWMDGSLPNHGIAIYSPTIGCNNACVFFGIYSSENTSEPGPYLEITMTTVEGDVSGDGTLNIVDALFIARHAVGLSVSNFKEDVADVNCDGKIDIVDALLVARKAVGLTVQGWCSD